MTVEPRRGVTHFEPRGGAPVFLSDMIMELGLAEKEHVEAAVDTARSSGETVGRILVREGRLTEDQLARALAARYGLNHIDLAEFEVDAAAANLLPPNAAQRYRAVPVAFDSPNGLLVAMADPSDSLALNDIAFMTKLEVHAAVAAENLIADLVGRLPLPASERREPPSYPPPAPPPPPPPVDTQIPSVFEPPTAAAPAPAPPAASSPADPELSSLRAELESTTAALDDERSKHAASVAELRMQLKQAHSESAGDAATDSEELEQARAEIERVRGKLAQKKQDLEAARAELAEKTEALEDAQSSDEAERTRKELERAIHERDQLRGDLDSARGELGQKSSELDSARAELSQKGGELDHARSELGHKSGDLERARTDLAQKSGELDQVRAEFDHSRAELDRSRGELDGVRAEAEQGRSELAQVRAELDQTRAELEAARVDVSRAAEALEKLDQLDEAEARVHEAHSTLEKMRNDFELEREQFAVSDRDLRARLASEEEQHEAAREAQVSMQKRVEALRAQNAALLDAYATAKRWSAEFARGAKELANTLEQPVLDDAVRAQPPSDDDARREGPTRFTRDDEEGAPGGDADPPPDWLK
ncbi:MAG TPA: hypothetical protein VGF74_08230 [Thermoleophilaceae bacterium]